MKIRILLAEDDPLLCKLVPAMLEQEEDLEIIETVSNGLDVPKGVTKIQPDVVLLDLKLPGCNGLDVLDQIRTLGSPTRVLILTADADASITVEAARRGAHGFVLKQEAVSVLPGAIRAVFSGEVWFPKWALSAILGEYPSLVAKVRQTESPVNQLSEKEREVLALVARGLTNQQIAAKLYMSVSTVKTHIRSLFQKLDLPNRTEAAVFAVREGLITDPQ